MTEPGAPSSAADVLVVGLDPFRVPGPWDPAPVAQAIAASMARLAELGIAADQCLVGLDGSDDVAAVVTAALRSQSWRCVVIGGGIRKEDSLVTLLETVVDLIRRHAPTAAIAFNTAPDDVADAVTRRVG